jgi:monooxygenase
MQKHGFTECKPVNKDSELKLLPMLLGIFTSGYILRAQDQVPKQGGKKPWQYSNNFFADYLTLKLGSLNDGILVFRKARGL